MILDFLLLFLILEIDSVFIIDSNILKTDVQAKIDEIGTGGIKEKI